MITQSTVPSTRFAPFRFMCPKCKSNRVSLHRELPNRWVDNLQGDLVVHCSNCGKMLYAAAAEAALSEQEEKHTVFVAEQQAEYEIAQAERQAAQLRALQAESSRKAAEIAARVPQCARVGCTLPVKENSKYCCTTHREQTARDAHAARKLAKQQNPDMIAVGNDFEVSCKMDGCEKRFIRKGWEVRRSKDKNFFCCHEHHQTWFKATGGPSKLGKQGAALRAKKS